MLAIHIGSVMPEAAFYSETDRMVRDVRETYQPMPGTNRAMLPGGIEEEQMQEHRRNGIRYGEMEQKSALSASQRLSVPLPWD